MRCSAEASSRTPAADADDEAAGEIARALVASYAHLYGARYHLAS